MPEKVSYQRRAARPPNGVKRTLATVYDRAILHAGSLIGIERAIVAVIIAEAFQLEPEYIATVISRRAEIGEREAAIAAAKVLRDASAYEPGTTIAERLRAAAA